MALSPWRTSESIVARYVTPRFLEGFAVDPSEYAITLKGGRQTDDVMSGGIAKRSFWDFFGRTRFIFADGRQRAIRTAISAVSADSFEVVADIALAYKIEPNLMQNLAGTINDIKTTLVDSDLERMLRFDGVEQSIKEIAGQHKGHELQSAAKTLDGLRQQYVKYGITIQSCTINWRYTQDVLALIEIKKQDLQRQLDEAQTLTEVQRIKQQIRVCDAQMHLYDLQINAARKEAELARARISGDPELTRKERELEIMRRDQEERLRIQREHEDEKEKAEWARDKPVVKDLIEMQRQRGAGSGPMIIGGTINIGGKKKE